jgi:hypothetical protein
MNAKTAKNLRRFIKKNKTTIIKDFMLQLQDWPASLRWRLAWKIIRNKKVKVKKGKL